MINTVEIIIPPVEISIKVLLAVLFISCRAMYVATTFTNATNAVPTIGSDGN